ncbi:TPA: glycosyltransferase family 4 protein, partial [Klebsiella aerogenes]|nr:glycosyltransferase family 4 protein [Klebsiella aerogenes]
KRIDLIVESFSQMPDKQLIVIGDGPEMGKIKSKAKGNIELLGYTEFSKLCEMMQGAKAFVFAAEEDFGIAPVEAMACGTPVIAFGKGGVTESVVPLGYEQPTGVFFNEQTVPSVIEAVKLFENNYDKFSPQNCRLRAEMFSAERFKSEIESYISDKWQLFNDAKKVLY